MSTKLKLTVSLLAILFSGSEAQADQYDKMAAELVRASQRHNKKRVAVLPFRGVGGGESTSGQVVSEKLIGPISNGEIEVVERTLLESVMKEQELGVFGVADSRSVKELGQVLGVDAIVTGTVIALKDDRIQVNARLIDASSAKILWAASAKVDKDWTESMMDNFSPFNVPVPPLPRFGFATPASAADWGSQERADCGPSGARIDKLERATLDKRARHWAKRLADKDFSPASLVRNPGSEIRNPQIRAEFYQLLRRYHDAPDGRRVTPAEELDLAEQDLKIRSLSESCG